MQSYNKLNKIVYSHKFESSQDLENNFFNELETAKNLGATSHIIAKFPHKGDEIEINKLKFTVKAIYGKKHEVILKLKEAKDA